MKKNTVAFIFGLCPLIPVTSNFAYGLITALAVWLLFFAGLLAIFIADSFNIKRFRNIFIQMIIFFAAVFYNVLVQTIFPMVIMTIEIYIYLTAFSYILFLSIAQYLENSDSIILPAIYSVMLLALSLIRELAAFGTISFPAQTGFIILNAFLFMKDMPFKFFGTNAGALIILGISCRIYLLVKSKGK